MNIKGYVSKLQLTNMIRERGMFSNRYLTRKGKQNTHHGNTEQDFPLAFTSNKYSSKERPSISMRKKKEDPKEKEQTLKNQQKNELISKLEKELKEARDQIKKLRGDIHNKQLRHEHLHSDMLRQLQQKNKRVQQMTIALQREEKKIKQLDNASKRYKSTIKEQIYWLLRLFVNVDGGSMAPQQFKHEIETNYRGFHGYIQQFNIQKQLQELASTSSIAQYQASKLKHIDSVFNQPNHPQNINSIFTEQIEDNNMIKLMDLQPFIDTFNNNQYQPGDSHIAKKLFSDSKDSPLFKKQKVLKSEKIQRDLQSGKGKQVCQINASLAQDSLNESSREESNEFLNMPLQSLVLPRDVKITKNFEPQSDQQNYIVLRKGETLKLLRRIRDKLWIGQYGERIGLVMQDFFQL